MTEVLAAAPAEAVTFALRRAGISALRWPAVALRQAANRVEPLAAVRRPLNSPLISESPRQGVQC